MHILKAAQRALRSTRKQIAANLRFTKLGTPKANRSAFRQGHLSSKSLSATRELRAFMRKESGDPL